MRNDTGDSIDAQRRMSEEISAVKSNTSKVEPEISKVEQEISKVEQEISKVEQEINEIKASLQELRREIQNVDVNISHMEEELAIFTSTSHTVHKKQRFHDDVDLQRAQSIQDYKSPDIENHTYLFGKLDHLKQKKGCLLQEQDCLRQEKASLRQEKDRLRQKEDRLRQKEAELVREIRALKPGRRGLKHEDIVNPDWEEVEADLAEAGFKVEQKVFRLNTSFLLRDKEDDHEVGERLLYCRKDFHKQWRFLEEDVCKEGYLGYIVGPPGTGKTLTTMAFMLSICKEGWSVMVVRLWVYRSVGLLEIVEGKQRTCKIRLNVALRSMEAILDEWTRKSKKKLLLFVDGYHYHIPLHMELLRECCAWREQDQSNRRLVVATSLGSRGKIYREEDTEMKVKEHHVYSWTLRECKEAVGYDCLYHSVTGVMEITDQPSVNVSIRDYQVESKYMIVGGSCRYMFQYPTRTAIEDYNAAMQSVTNYRDFVLSLQGERGITFVNRLHALFREKGKEYVAPISKFVGTELARKLGESFVHEMMTWVDTNNPSMKGFFFEMLFFARLGKGKKLSVTDRCFQKKRWKVSAVIDFQPKKTIRLPATTRVCLKPMKWNQGGYDAVIVDTRKRLVRFVQVTIGKAHDLNLEHHRKCLKALKIGGEAGWKVRIVFIVDKNRLPTFKVSQVKRSLEEFRWIAGEKPHVDIFGMDPQPRS